MSSLTHVITEYISFIVLPLVGFLLCLASIVLTFICVKSPSHSNILPIGCLFITTLDIYVDIAYLIILILHFDTIYDGDFIPLLLYSSSLFISILINIIFSTKILSQQFKFNQLAISWKKEHKYFILLIHIISSFDLSLILILTSKILNKSWSSAPFHPFVMERVQIWSVITKLIENIPQIYVTIDLLHKLSSWDPDTYPTKTILSPISIATLAVTTIDILISFYTFCVYKRNTHKHPRHTSKGSNVQIGDHSQVQIDQTPLAGDV